MKKEAKITVLLLAVLFLGFSVLCWMKPAEEYSVTERRKLEQFPELTLKTLVKGEFMMDLEEILIFLMKQPLLFYFHLLQMVDRYLKMPLLL